MRRDLQNDGAATPGASPEALPRRFGRLLTRLLAAPLIVLAAILTVAAALGQLGALRHDFDAFSAVRPQISVALALLGLLLAALRARIAAAAALALGVYGLATLGPAWRSPAPAPAACATVPLRVAIANIEAVGSVAAHFGGVEANLRALNADVVALVEASPRFYDAASGLRADLPHSVGRKGAWGAVILSRHPLVDLTARPWPDGAPINELARLDLNGVQIGVAAFHLSRPIIGPQEREVAAIGPLLAALPDHRILLGDFNAAPWSHAVAEIERDAGVRMTPGFLRTWRGVYPNPFFGWRIPALYGAQIDHVLTSAAFGVRAADVFDVPGSVHWGVVADLDAPTAATAPGCAG